MLSYSGSQLLTYLLLDYLIFTPCFFICVYKHHQIMSQKPLSLSQQNLLNESNHNNDTHQQTTTKTNTLFFYSILSYMLCIHIPLYFILDFVFTHNTSWIYISSIMRLFFSEFLMIIILMQIWLICFEHEWNITRYNFQWQMILNPSTIHSFFMKYRSKIGNIRSMIICMVTFSIAYLIIHRFVFRFSCYKV